MNHPFHSSITRCALIVTLVAMLLTNVSVAQSEFDVLDWKREQTLNTYLVQQMHKQYDERRKAFYAAMASKSGTITYREDIRRRFRELLGPLPERSALNPQVTGVIHQQGYRVEKVVYESSPFHHVTANLYIPEGKGPFPAVLHFCGHEDAAKATPSYQQMSILLAKNGFVVLVVDPVSQAERHQLTDVTGKPLTRGGTTEHTLLNQGSHLVGTSLPARELWDNVRSMDYLTTRSEVDTSRIGCMGNSGGAMQAMYFIAYDERVKVIAVASYLASRERTLELSGPADGCAQIPGEGASGLEMTDYLITAAPKPLLVVAGRYDFIDYNSTLAAYRELQSVYGSLQHSNRLSLFTYDDGHGISKPKREAIAGWFRRWFLGDSVQVKEPYLPVQAYRSLQVTKTGQVNNSFPDEVNVMKYNLARADSLLPNRRSFQRLQRDTIFARTARLLGINVAPVIPDTSHTGKVTKNRIVFHKMILRREGEVPLPVLLALPSSIPRQVCILLYEKGKRLLADSGTLILNFLSKGFAVVLADVRGTGETEDRPEFNDPKYYNVEYRNAVLSLHAGKNIVGQRTTDILTLLDFVAHDEDLGNLPVEIFASGFNALPALHAALFRDAVRMVHLQLPFTSFREILERPEEKNWYSYVIPGVLQYYELSDLVKLVGLSRVRMEKKLK